MKREDVPEAGNRAVRLYELAYACRLYAEFTDYDKAVLRLRQVTPGGIDLEVGAHRISLLKWLNAWGCRQFSVEHHPIASRALQSWGRRHSSLLPSPGASLLTFSDSDFDRAVQAYDRLRGLRAGFRSGQSGEYAVTFGPTGAAKILYALRPRAFPPWDEPIREALHLDETGASFRKYLVRVQAALRGVVEDAGRHGLKEVQIPAAIDRPTSSLPKLLDEFYWVTITKGVRVPPPDQLARWSRWANKE